jgi:phosphoribulokinase
MSIKNPVIAITGSSGAGTTSVTRAFQHIFRREKLNAAIIEGDSFHRYDRVAMRETMAEKKPCRRPPFQPLRTRGQPAGRTRGTVPRIR